MNFNFYHQISEKAKNSERRRFNSFVPSVIPLSLFISIGAIIATLSGADSSFDSLNYHLFNGWATFRNTNSDFLPTSIWTFFPSHLDFLYFTLWSNFPSVIVSIIFGGLQGILGYLVYQTVTMFENQKTTFSLRGVFFGTLAIGTPLFLAQFGNSMHDATLAVIEFYVFYKLLIMKLSNTAGIPKSVPILLGFILALKPAHLTFVLLTIILLVIHIRAIGKILRTLALFVLTFMVLSSPWWYKSFIVTGNPFFPYLQIGKPEILSGGLSFRSYEEWEINNFSDFTKHLFFPGGSPSFNHEIPFTDFTIPITLLIASTLLVLALSRKNIEKSDKDLLMIGSVVYGFAIVLFVSNQIIFTGIRYSLVSFPIIVCALGIWSNLRKHGYRIFVNSFLTLLLVLNFILPDSIFLPNQKAHKSLSHAPDYGRTGQTFTKSITSGYLPGYPIRQGDIVLLGQEQVSFVAPLWNIDASFIGLQAYILGEDAKSEINSRMAASNDKGRSIYLVALTQNLATMNSQVKQIGSTFEIVECQMVANPFNRQISLCRVTR